MRHIFWAHSPIGYEVFRSFRDYKLADENNSLLVTARNFYPPDADCNIGLPEEYVWMNEAQFEAAKNRLIELVKRCEGGDYILYIPQTANFFIRCLIESPRCVGFHLFDEGSSAREPSFSKRVAHQGFYKYALRGESGLQEFFDFLEVDAASINKMYSSGVPFYELGHPKFLGFMSHFKKAFPGKEVTQVLRSELAGTDSCGQYALVLLPPFHTLMKTPDFNSRLHNLINSVKTIQKLDSKLKLVIKFHPHDTDDVVAKISRLFNGIPFESFCAEKNISRFREPAFMGFKVYIGYPNSTVEFLKEIGGNYIAF